MGNLGPVSDDTNAPRPSAPSPAALARMAPRPTPPPAAEAPAMTTDHSASAAFGRVDEEGKVFVKDGEGEREVGSYPGATPEEALQYFARKYDELFASATLLRQRLDSHDVSAKEIADGLKSLREHAEQPQHAQRVRHRHDPVGARLRRFDPLACHRILTPHRHANTGCSRSATRVGRPRQTTSRN